jgi:hypothetical protein
MRGASLPRLVIFKGVFLERLRKDLHKNVGFYDEPDSWLLGSGDPTQRYLETGIDFKDSLDLVEPQGSDLGDAENAVRLHKALGHLSRLQARDPRLWARLTHIELWSYMRKRWRVERFTGDKAVRFVESRYFVVQAQGRALLRNGAARLWWSAQLSYDGDRSDPYELTRVLFHYLDITQSILERNLGRSSTVTTAFLGFLLENQDPLLKGGDLNRKRIRGLAKYLNLHGGFCLLDVLLREQITDLLRAELGRILSEEEPVALGT